MNMIFCVIFECQRYFQETLAGHFSRAFFSHGLPRNMDSNSDSQATMWLMQVHIFCMEQFMSRQIRCSFVSLSLLITIVHLEKGAPDLSAFPFFPVIHTSLSDIF